MAKKRQGRKAELIFSVLENGEEKYRGSAPELGKILFCKKDIIYKYEKEKRIFNGQYEFKLAEVIDPYAVTEEIKVRMTPFEETIIELVRRLKIWGNTTLPRIRNDELQTYLEALEEQGCPCDVRAYKQRTGQEISLPGSKPNGKYDTDYVITLRR